METPVMMLDIKEAPAQAWIVVQASTASGTVRIVEPENGEAEVYADYVRMGAAEFRSWTRLPADIDLSGTELFD